jgi:hypothetical protein
VIAVPGSEWRCQYDRLGPSKPVPNDPRSIRYAEYLHSISCVAGVYGAVTSVMCPLHSSELVEEMKARGGTRMAESLVLIEQTSSGEQRYGVTISCEP